MHAKTNLATNFNIYIYYASHVLYHCTTHYNLTKWQVICCFQAVGAKHIGRSITFTGNTVHTILRLAVTWSGMTVNSISLGKIKNPTQSSVACK